MLWAIAAVLIAADWHKAVLHAHCDESDDASTPKAALLTEARDKGFTFVAITDHDIDADSPGDPTVTWFSPEYVAPPGMVLGYGVEWTSLFGHATIIAAQPFDYTPMWDANLASNAVAARQAAEDAGALFTPAHWLRGGLPGIKWLYGHVGEHAIETVNGNPEAPLAISVWEAHLLNGHRVTAVGGSDSHHQHPGYSHPIGVPTTWVYAEVDATSVIDAIRSGHVSISRDWTAARLDFTADTDLDGEPDAMVGDQIEAGVANLLIRLDGDHPALRVRLIRNGRVIGKWDVPPSVDDLSVETLARPGFYRVDAWTPMLGPLPGLDFYAMTNAIYVE